MSNEAIILLAFGIVAMLYIIVFTTDFIASRNKSYKDYMDKKVCIKSGRNKPTKKEAQK